jgi:hypothetical protein
MNLSRTLTVVVATLAVVGSGAALAAASSGSAPDDRGGLVPRDGRVEPGDDRDDRDGGPTAPALPDPTPSAAASGPAVPSPAASPDDSGTAASGRDLPRDQRVEAGDDRRVQGLPAGSAAPSPSASDDSDDSDGSDDSDDSDRSGPNPGSDD